MKTLIIVEGKTDEMFLQCLFDELFGPHNYAFCEIQDDEGEGGDLTSLRDVHSGSIVSKMLQLAIEPYMSKEFLSPKDISEIIQITDIDGAFVSQSAIRECGSTKIKYGDSTVECQNASEIIARNAQKSDNLKYLSSLSSVRIGERDVPYSIFYFSCNIDHFVCRNANLKSRQKRQEANLFSLHHRKDAVEYFAYDEDSSMRLDYKSSWQFIFSDEEDGLRSLKRHTNIDVLIRRFKSQN